ncbi:MAG: hypothetical protein UW78_C0030G0003, partial [Candidatus Azambacteria bacterium GW2011_GWA1_44_9]
MDQEERVKSLDAEIARITKSTRTTVPALLSIHDLLRQKYPWYYKWHLNPWSSKIHTAILSLVLISFLTVGSLSIFGLPHSARAATTTCTWNNGAGTTSWNTSGNWSCGNVPDNTNDVVLDATSNTAITIDATATAASFTVNAGYTQIITANNNLTLDTSQGGTGTFTLGGATYRANATTITIPGSWTNTAGTFTAGTSTVIMTGTGAIDVGTNGYASTKLFKNLTINTSGTVTLSNQISATGILTLTTGTLNGAVGINIPSPTSASFVNNGITYGASKPYIYFILNSTSSGSPDIIPATTLSNPYPNVQMKGNTSSGTNYANLAGDINISGALEILGNQSTNKTVISTTTSNYAITLTSYLAIGYTVATRQAELNINNSTLTVSGNLTIYNGSGSTKLISGASGLIKVGGNFVNSDTLDSTAGGTVEFNKASSTQTLNSGGTGATQLFNNLTHSGAGTLQLITNDINIDGTFTNSAGTFDADTNDKNMTFAGAWNNTGSATFSRGSGTMTFDGTSTVTNSSSAAATLAAVAISGTATLGSNLTMASNSGAGTLNLGAGSYTFTITGTGTPMAVTTFQAGTGSTTIYTGTTTATNIAAKVYNNLTLTPTLATTYSLAGHLNAANSTAMTGNLLINASATLTTTGTNYNIDCVNLTIAASGVLTANGSTFTVSGNWVATGGTFTYGTSTVKMMLSGSITSSSSFYNLEAAQTGQTTTNLGNIYIYHQLVLAGDSTGHWAGEYTNAIFGSTAGLANPCITSNGANFTGSASATFWPNGTTLYIPAGTFYARIIVANVSTTTTETVELSGDITTTDSVRVYSNANGGNVLGSLDMKGYNINTPTILVGVSGNTGRHGQIINSSASTDSTITATAVAGSDAILIYAGAGFNKINASGTKTINLNVAGNWTNSDTFTAGASTVSFTATSGTQTLNSGGTGATQLFNNLTHSGAGTLQLLTNNINIDGNFINSAGTFNTNSLDMSVAGNVNLTTGSFTQGTRTITLDGSGAQSFTAGGTGVGHTPYNITVTNASASGVTFADSLTLATSGTLADNTANSKLTFTAGATYTIPTLDLDGTAGNLVSLRSSTPGTHYHTNVTNAPTLTYVDAQDSDASGGALITANTSNDSGNNTNWTFGSGVTYISGTAYTNENKSTNVGVGISIALSVNGGAKNITTTTTNGVFSFNSVGVAANNTLTFFIDDVTNKGNLVTQVLNTTNDITGLEMYTDDISLRHETAGPMTNTLLATAATLADANMFFSVDGSSVATFSKKLWVESGYNYTPGGGIIDTSDLEVRGTATFAPEANAVSVTGNWTMSATGTFTTSGTITFDKGSSTQTLVSGGKTFSSITHSGAGTLQLTTNDLDTNGTFTNSAGTFD